MPKSAVDYSKTIIYKIVCNNLKITDCYVGPTTNFTIRKNSHKKDSQNTPLKLYIFIRENGGWENFAMIEIEKFSCDDKNEATARERFWYEQLNSTLNCQCPNRSIEEYQREYRENNKEKMREFHKKYNEENKE